MHFSFCVHHRVRARLSGHRAAVTTNNVSMVSCRSPIDQCRVETDRFFHASKKILQSSLVAHHRGRLFLMLSSFSSKCRVVCSLRATVKTCRCFNPSPSLSSSKHPTLDIANLNTIFTTTFLAHSNTHRDRLNEPQAQTITLESCIDS
jgi:hypothetical protein